MVANLVMTVIMESIIKEIYSIAKSASVLVNIFTLKEQILVRPLSPLACIHPSQISTPKKEKKKSPPKNFFILPMSSAESCL